jgi:hypothetical protein
MLIKGKMRIIKFEDGEIFSLDISVAETHFEVPIHAALLSVACESVMIVSSKKSGG